MATTTIIYDPTNIFQTCLSALIKDATLISLTGDPITMSDLETQVTTATRVLIVFASISDAICDKFLDMGFKSVRRFPLDDVEWTKDFELHNHLYHSLAAPYILDKLFAYQFPTYTPAIKNITKESASHLVTYLQDCKDPLKKLRKWVKSYNGFQFEERASIIGAYILKKRKQSQQISPTNDS